MIPAHVAHALAKSSYERLRAQDLSRLLRRCEQAVVQACNRGEWHARIPGQEFNNGELIRTLRELGFGAEYTWLPREKIYCLRLWWGQAREPEKG